MKALLTLIVVILLSSCGAYTEPNRDHEMLVVSETEYTIDSIYINRYTGEVLDHVITDKLNKE